MNDPGLLHIQGLAAALPLPVRAIRRLMTLRKIPFLRIGCRTIRFELPKVREALGQYEVKALKTVEAVS